MHSEQVPPELSVRAGLGVVVLGAGRRLQRCAARGADVVLVVLQGRLVVEVGVAGESLRTVDAGGTAACPRAVPFALVAGDQPVRVLVLSAPAGVEAVLVALADGVAGASLVGMAADCGVDLLLEPVTREPTAAEPSVKPGGTGPASTSS